MGNMKQPICVHLRKPLRKVYQKPLRRFTSQTRMPTGIREHCASRSFGLSAVRDFDTHSLPQLPIGAPNSLKYLILCSYEFVLSSLFILYPALRSWRTLRCLILFTAEDAKICSKHSVFNYNEFLYAEKSVKVHICPQYLKYVLGA